jgi:hypothetical protein
MTELLNSELMNYQPFPGLSLFFILLFFAPLLLVTLVTFLFARTGFRRKAKFLTWGWAVASIPAGLLILMGYAFQAHGWNPFIQIALWFGAGMLIIWPPLLAREALAKLGGGSKQNA